MLKLKIFVEEFLGIFIFVRKLVSINPKGVGLDQRKGNEETNL